MTTEGHNSMAAKDELMAFVERVERLKAEKRDAAAEFNDQIKEVFQEAKGSGYDTAAMKEAIRLRAMGKDKRAMVSFYSDVLGVFG